MKHFIADIEKARVLTVAMLRAAAEEGLTVGEACREAQMFLHYRGFAVPEDPLAFATAGRITMRDGNLDRQFEARPSGEVL